MLISGPKFKWMCHHLFLVLSNVSPNWWPKSWQNQAQTLAIAKSWKEILFLLSCGEPHDAICIWFFVKIKEI